MTSSARLFNCARCHALTIVCRTCDRGQRYYPSTCRVQASRDSQRRASLQYQKTRRGRHANAQRQRRYRERQRNKVTHQGSVDSGSPAVLPARANKVVEMSGVAVKVKYPALRCHFCLKQYNSFLRRDFLCSSSRPSSWRRSTHEHGQTLPMSISKELEAKILRYHFVEQWGVNNIAAQMRIHHTTVDRVLCQAGLPRVERARRASIVDPYYPMILEELAKYPRLSATRLLGMAKVRGYQGGASQLRAHVAQLRPRKVPEAYLRLKTLQGDQGQVDWGAFGHVQIGRARRPLMAFVMVLSWSRKIFLRFYLNQRMDNFLRGHVAAFTHWNGLPKILLYDNLKSAALERSGDAIRLHPTLIDLATHYRFEPRPCAPYRGNEKGRVERSIRFIRNSFFIGREWSDIDDLNAQALQWCDSVACERRCPEDPDITVGQAFEQEQPTLITLPDNPYATHEHVEDSVGKTPYVRFDLNDYSLPYTAVRRGVTVIATLERVTVHQDGAQIASHPRSFAKGEQIENNDHAAALVALKKQA